MITHTVKPVFVIKPVKKSRNHILTRCVTGNDYSDQTFDDVDTVLVKYFTFRSTQYTLAQVYEMDRSPMKSEFNWLCDFSNEFAIIYFVGPRIKIRNKKIIVWRSIPPPY